MRAGSTQLVNLGRGSVQRPNLKVDLIRQGYIESGYLEWGTSGTGLKESVRLSALFDEYNYIMNSAVKAHDGKIIGAATYAEESNYYGYRLDPRAAPGGVGDPFNYPALLFPDSNQHGSSIIYVESRSTYDSTVTGNGVTAQRLAVTRNNEWMPVIDVSLTRGDSPWTYLYYLRVGGSRSTGEGASISFFENRGEIWRLGSTDGFNWGDSTLIWTKSLGGTRWNNKTVDTSNWSCNIRISKRPVSIAAVGTSQVFIGMINNVVRIARGFDIDDPVFNPSGTSIYGSDWENRAYHLEYIYNTGSSFSGETNSGMHYSHFRNNLQAVALNDKSLIAISAGQDRNNQGDMMIFEYDGSNIIEKPRPPVDLPRVGAVYFDEVQRKFKTTLISTSRPTLVGESNTVYLSYRALEQMRQPLFGITNTNPVYGVTQQVINRYINQKEVVTLATSDGENWAQDTVVGKDAQIWGVTFAPGATFTVFAKKDVMYDRAPGAFYRFSGLSDPMKLYYININSLNYDPKTAILTAYGESWVTDISKDIESYRNNDDTGINLSLRNIAP